MLIFHLLENEYEFPSKVNYPINNKFTPFKGFDKRQRAAAKNAAITLP